MEEFVPGSQIIKELNGSEDWAYNYVEPVPGENDKMKDTETKEKLLAERNIIVKNYENATLEWIHGGEKSVEELRTRRNELASKLRDDYWKIDPYIRARSFYDRTGLINPGGKIQFYPGKTITPVPEGPNTTAPNGVKQVETFMEDID